MYFNNSSDRNEHQIQIGLNVVEPYLASSVVDQGRELLDLYKVETHKLQTSSKKNFEKYENKHIVYANAPKLIDRVCTARKYNKVHIKLYADGGRGFLKLGLSIISADNSTSDSCEKIKSSGVKKAILLALVEDCIETHFNMDVLFKLTEINNVAYTFHADFKLLLYVIGNCIALFSYLISDIEHRKKVKK